MVFAFGGTSAVAVDDLDGDGHPDLAAANSGANDISVLLGHGDGTFGSNVDYGAGLSSRAVTAHDLDGDGRADLAVASEEDWKVYVLLNLIPAKTIACGLSCLPAAGTVPFTMRMELNLENRITDQTRRIAGRFSVLMGSGSSYSNWRSGWSDVGADSNQTTSWNQNIPALGFMIGNNVFTLVAEDVTPAPFNQPPYALSGDTDTDRCTVIGIAP